MEQVLCIEVKKLAKEWVEQKVAIPINISAFSGIAMSEIDWISRSSAEDTFSHKQIIVYCIVENSNGQLACYPRNGNEHRLHGLWSLGVGGHVDKQDASDSFMATCQKALQRELLEEFADLQLNNTKLSFKGVINEEYSQVGQAHLGLVYKLTVVGDAPKPAQELDGLVWVDKDRVKNYNIELWSSLAMQL